MPKAALKPLSTEEEPHEKRRYPAESSKLPLVSKIDDQRTMKLAVELLEEARELLETKTATDARLDEINQELIGLAAAYDLPSFRYGRIGLQYNG